MPCIVASGMPKPPRGLSLEGPQVTEIQWISNTIHQALKQLRPAREIINSNLL